MIKIDVVSGFLGVGKTTLIKKYLQVLQNKGEKVVLIENDFGSIGIDKQLFQADSLAVYEINHGCICCTLRGNFLAALQEISKEIQPDRVIIEPSGIFVLSEIFDFFSYPSVEDHYELNGLVTVVDALNYEDEKKKFGLFFTNQIENAQALVLSKTTLVSDEVLLSIVEELNDQYHGREIIACNWDELNDDEIYRVFNGQKIHQAMAGHLAQMKKVSLEYKRERGFHGFTSCSFRPTGKYTEDGLAEKLENLSDMGEILRAKGFLFGDKVDWEFQYVNGQYQITPKSDGITESAVSFIGRNIGQEAILAAFV